jgi:spore maturation protein CgeB
VSRPYDLVVLGLSLSSSWGNGHATTYRALLAGLHAAGLEVLFLERDRPWYAANRDLPRPDFCRLEFYDSVESLKARFQGAIRNAQAVILGSFVPDGVAIADFLFACARGTTAFYDIDTPVTLAKLERGDEEYIARRQVPDFSVYFSFTGGPTLKRLQSAFAAQRALPLYCSVAERDYRPTGERVKWQLGYLGTYSADRQPGLDRLLIEPARRSRQKNFAVAGPQYPADIRWPKNVLRIEHLSPPLHASFYSRQRFTVNVTRASMAESGWSPSVRLFEAAACGTPIISDPWPGLTELLPEGEAVLIARRADDVMAILNGISDQERKRIAAAARDRVLAGHTGRARAKELMDALALEPSGSGRRLALAG